MHPDFDESRWSRDFHCLARKINSRIHDQISRFHSFNFDVKKTLLTALLATEPALRVVSRQYVN